MKCAGGGQRRWRRNSLPLHWMTARARCGCRLLRGGRLRHAVVTNPVSLAAEVVRTGTAIAFRGNGGNAPGAAVIVQGRQGVRGGGDGLRVPSAGRRGGERRTVDSERRVPRPGARSHRPRGLGFGAAWLLLERCVCGGAPARQRRGRAEASSTRLVPARVAGRGRPRTDGRALPRGGGPGTRRRGRPLQRLRRGGRGRRGRRPVVGSPGHHGARARERPRGSRRRTRNEVRSIRVHWTLCPSSTRREP